MRTTFKTLAVPAFAALFASAAFAAPDASTDVVIVGAGGAGMAAAIEARTANANVILLEKLAFPGGSTLLASTAFNAGGSSVQKKMDKVYTADDYYRKLEKGAKGQELENVRQLADLSGPTADWLIGMGADLGKVINGSQHTRVAGGALGQMLAPVLLNKVESLTFARIPGRPISSWRTAGWSE